MQDKTTEITGETEGSELQGETRSKEIQSQNHCQNGHLTQAPVIVCVLQTTYRWRVSSRSDFLFESRRFWVQLQQLLHDRMSTLAMIMGSRPCCQSSFI